MHRDQLKEASQQPALDPQKKRFGCLDKPTAPVALADPVIAIV
jgi:hypothetical protein